MYIRIRAILVVFLTTLIIISFSVFVGILTVRNSVETSQEADLVLVSDIADLFLSTEIGALKQKAENAAQLLSMSDGEEWQAVLADFLDRHPEFLGMAVFDDASSLIISLGTSPATLEAMDDIYVLQAFGGKTAISSTIPSPHGQAFYVAAALPNIDGLVLALTLPGTYFSDLVATFSIWETGHIFIDDAAGHLISNPRPDWVAGRVDFTHMAGIDAVNEKAVGDARSAGTTEATIVHYSIDGVERLCAYRPISGSEEGWLLGVVAPLPESPFRSAESGLVVVGGLSLFLSLVAAVVASGFIKKPFAQIAALKDEAESSSKYKSDFLASMSHEIRTPMNSILGVTEILMRDNTLPQNVEDGLGKIYTSGDLLLTIINDILDLSKIEAGKLELFPSNYEVASLINDTATLNMMRLGSKEIEFNISVDENIPRTLYGDEVRIKQILNNLLSNAFKYTEKGTVILSFSTRTDYEEGGDNVILVLNVSDTGQGMTEKQVQSLFDRYTRFNYEANRTIEGTGLGMSITRNLVDLMSGEIYVHSKPQRGSVFTVLLPQERSGTEVLGKELAEKLQDFSLEGKPLSRKANITYEPMPYGSVLIVDDVDSNLFVAKGLMLPYNLSIETVTSGFAAIDRIKGGKVYDIVFMDHMMPEMDGIETTKILRELGYKHPIVALTANAVKGQQEVFLKNGFDEFISKPIDTRRLNTLLKSYIRDKQPPAVLEAVRRKVRDTAERSLQVSIDPQSSVDPKLAELFIQDALKVAGLLEEISKKDGAYDDGDDVGAYTTAVHSMKSALAYVSEPDLSTFAAKLEQAGLNRDSALMAAETSIFLSKLREVIEKLTPQKTGETEGTAAIGDYDFLKDELQAIKDACEVYDRKAAKEMISGLTSKKWPADVSEPLGSMSEYLISGDFDEVSNVADRILGII